MVVYVVNMGIILVASELGWYVFGLWLKQAR